MYDTLEKLQKECPIGSVYKVYWIDIYKEKHESTIDGYIFDGKYWYPAILTYDGWIPINEEDINI